MKRFFVSEQNINEENGLIVIDKQEFLHAKNVVRLKVNDKIVCVCGNGFEYICKIKEVLNSSMICTIEQKKICQQTPKHNITLFQVSLKGDNFEFVIQKMAELGLSAIVPFQSRFSVSKLKEEKIKRYEAISKNASKQCGRSDFLKIESISTFKQVISKLKEFDLIIFAYEKEKQQNLRDLQIKQFKNKKIALIVGSEGGFDEQEAKTLLENNAFCVSLGKRILRAETASITLASIIMFLLEEI